MMCVCIVRVQLQRALELSLRPRPIQPVVKNQSQRRVSFSGLWVDFNGFERRCIGPWKRFRRRVEAMPCEPATAICQSRVGRAVRWISVYCQLEVKCFPLQTLKRTAESLQRASVYLQLAI